MKILIVEDEPSLREIMQRALAQERYVVETATNYAEADAKLAAYTYDCILLDIMLPDGNGLQLLEHLKQQRKRENVIIISARDSLDEIMITYGLSGQDVIRQIHPSIFDLGVSDYDKVKLIDKCGEIEFRIVEGSNERIQLEALLAYFLMIGGNAR